MPMFTVRFAHLKTKPPLRLGQVIRRGDLIGTMGNTGASTAAHLHKLYRYKVRGDIVTILPPSWLGYVHIGKRNALGKVSFPWHTNHYIDRYLNTLE